jgi:PhnB protein
MDFYRQVLGGDLRTLTYGECGHAASPETADWVIHACLTDGPLQLMASDRHPSVPHERGNQMQLSYDLPTVEAMERAYATLVDGGEATVPPHDSFWGARFGMLTDRFGTRWMLVHNRAPAAETPEGATAGATVGAA